MTDPTHPASTDTTAEGGAVAWRASAPTDRANTPVSDYPGMTVWLVPEPVNAGLCIRKWTNEGLEPGSHRLIPECLAEREIHRLRMALEEIDALPVMEINPNNYTHDDVEELNESASAASLIAQTALGFGAETDPNKWDMERLS